MRTVNASRTESNIKVEISEFEEQAIVIDHIKNKFFPPSCTHYDWYVIENDNLVGVIDYGGHGSGFTEKRIVGTAKEDDKLAIAMLNKLGW